MTGAAAAFTVQRERVMLEALMPRLRQARLTPRERRIVRRILAGRTNRAIADDLGVSYQSVRNALTVIYEKCGVRTRLELALVAAARKKRRG